MTATVSFLKGCSATAAGFNLSNSVLSRPGMSVPAGLGVVNNTTILVTSHSGVFGCGVTLAEYENRNIDITPHFSPGSMEYEGTIMYRLDPGLSFQPKLVIEPGHIGSSSDPYALVLGWVSYPGGNEALSENHLFAAQTAKPFSYSYFANSRVVLSALPLRYDPALVQMVDIWYGANHPEMFTLKLAVDNTTTNVQVSVREIEGEHWVVFSNTGSSTQNFDVEFEPNNNDEASTALHSRIFMDIGAVISMGIHHRGLGGERTLSAGTIAGPVSKGTFSVSLVETKTPVRETFRIKYHVTLPGGKTLGLSGFGTSNDSFFGNKFNQD